MSHFELFHPGRQKNIIDLNDRCIYNIAIMKKLFVKYVSQNILGMVGMSLYILADTFFISKAVGSNGITALNLVLPVYNLIFAGINIVGSAILSAVESVKYAFAASIMRGFIAISIFAFALSAAFGMTGVWLAFPAAEFVTMFIIVKGLRKNYSNCNR